MASKKAKEIWNLGVPICDAWLRFAPAGMAAEYEQTPGLIEALQFNPEPKSKWDFLAPLSVGIAKSQAKQKLESEMREHLLCELFNGQLIATGYREFPSRSQSQVVIDPVKFDHDDPDWQRETLTAHGIRYGQIRVTNPSVIPILSGAKERISSLSAIEDAIAKLALAKPDFATLPRKTACDMVRNTIGANYNSGNGLSNQHISKAIVRLCGSKRITRNSN